MKNKILEIVTDYYLQSRDFNGIQIWNLSEEIGKNWNAIKKTLKTLVEENLVGIIDDKTDVNPNIIRLGFEPLEIQLKKLEAEEPGYMCIYPRTNHLRNIIEKKEFEGEPYKLRLALGEAQLAYSSFDLSILELYRNDPRYEYKNSDIQGQICYSNEDLSEPDKIYLQTYGFSYDAEFNRGVAVFLRYLTDLTPEHQQLWKTKEISGEFKLHPDYFRSSIQGDWGEKIPICQAILKELFIINKMASAMDRPPLFKHDYGEYGENRPKRFHFLIRPTLEEFNNFVLLFDKMLSDNINKKFFQNEIEFEWEKERGDGKIMVTQKGTIQILNDWVRKFFKTSDWEPWEETIKSLKKVRKLRQKPAHSINEDIFDQKYFREQRSLILEVYQGIRNIRLIFANHPKVKNSNIEIPDWLQNGKIWHI